MDSIGYKPIQPLVLDDLNGRLKVSERGLTYRQWLIGMIATGVSADVNSNRKIETMADFVQSVIAKADAIISQLDEEGN